MRIVELRNMISSQRNVGGVLMYLMFYALTGVLAGVFAGLFGVGGGLIVVPILTALFAAQQMPEAHVLHLALGTSLASIMFTSLSSMRAHHTRGAVEWQIVRRISPGILAGAFFGSWLAAQIPTRFLRLFFVAFLFYVAIRIVLEIKPQLKKPFSAVGISGAGSLIGAVSSLVGIGGGTMSVPFLLRCNVSMHNAIGTSAAIGFPIALAGALGYVIHGSKVSGLPAGTVGFIYLPALLVVSIASIVTAPLGAKLAHNLPVLMLRKIFAGLLVIMGIKMLAGLF